MEAKKEDYLFIPPVVRYNLNLPPNAKLLFGEIALRTNDKGFSVFGNQELADLFCVDKQSIYYWVTALQEEGIIQSRTLRKRKVHYRVFLNLLDPANQPL